MRVPLLDLEVVQFATQVPATLKQRGRVGKAIFKQAMEPYLPRDSDLSAEDRASARRCGAGCAGSCVRRSMTRWTRATLRRRGFFDPAAVQRLIDADRAGTIDGSYTIFALMCFELWCRRFVDR